jgi:hypothetical protein
MRLPFSLDRSFGHIEVPISVAAESINYGCSGANAFSSIERELLISQGFCSDKRPE